MRAWRKDDRGNVAVMFSVSVFALLAMVGGAFTMARVNTAGTRLQDAADGAALAAAVEAQALEATDADIHDAAERWAASALRNAPNFDGPATTRVTLTKRSPVEVSVSLEQSVDTLFAGAVGVEHITVKRQATAVGGPRRVACLIVLEPLAPGAIDIQGNPRIQGENCVAHVNSIAPEAIQLTGNASAGLEAVYVSGPAGPLKQFTPTPQFNQPALADPLAKKIKWPAAQPCPTRGAPTKGRLSPGVYCDGLEIEAGTELEPGIYVVQSGDVVVNGRGSHGDGVTLVLLDPTAIMDMKGNNSLRLSAPKTGDWAGIAIAAKPGPIMATSRLFGELELDGDLYLPGHKIALQGNSHIGGAGSRALIIRQFDSQGAPRIELSGGFPSAVVSGVRLAE